MTVLLGVSQVHTFSSNSLHPVMHEALHRTVACISSAAFCSVWNGNLRHT